MPTAGESSKRVAAAAASRQQKAECRLLERQASSRRRRSISSLLSLSRTHTPLSLSIQSFHAHTNSYEAEYDEAPEDVSVARVEKMKTQEEEAFAVVGF